MEEEQEKSEYITRFVNGQNPINGGELGELIEEYDKEGGAELYGGETPEYITAFIAKCLKALGLEKNTIDMEMYKRIDAGGGVVARSYQRNRYHSGFLQLTNGRSKHHLFESIVHEKIHFVLAPVYLALDRILELVPKELQAHATEIFGDAEEPMIEKLAIALVDVIDKGIPDGKYFYVSGHRLMDATEYKEFINEHRGRNIPQPDIPDNAPIGSQSTDSSNPGDPYPGGGEEIVQENTQEEKEYTSVHTNKTGIILPDDFVFPDWFMQKLLRDMEGGRNPYGLALSESGSVMIPSDGTYADILALYFKVREAFDYFDRENLPDVRNVVPKIAHLSDLPRPKTIGERLALGETLEDIFPPERVHVSIEDPRKVDVRKDLVLETRKPYSVVDLLVESGLAPSKKQARRLIEQKGVRFIDYYSDGSRKINPVEDVTETLTSFSPASTQLQVGRNSVKIVIKEREDESN